MMQYVYALNECEFPSPCVSLKHTPRNAVLRQVTPVKSFWRDSLHPGLHFALVDKTIWHEVTEKESPMGLY